MTNDEFEESQRVNLESIAALRQSTPFNNPDIEKFYTKNLGDGPNDFISTNPLFRETTMIPSTHY